MALHLKKLCVGIDSLAAYLEHHKTRVSNGKMRVHTRNRPRRAEELLAGGSLYWIISGQICVRHRIIGLETGEGPQGPVTHIQLDGALQLVTPRPHRPFQGWRYLDAEDAPADLKTSGADEDLPPELQAQLANDLLL